MLEQIQKYLSDKLIDAGITTTVLTTMKELESYSGTHVGAVIIDKDNLEKYKKTTRFSLDDKTFNRVQKFKRETTVNVIIGEYDAESCDAIFTKFLTILDSGFYDDNKNYVYLEILEADWISDKDSILLSNMAVQVPIKCTSDVYNDYKFVDVTPVIEVVEKVEE